MEFVRIENWELVNIRTSPYQPPETSPSRLQGKVYGHPEFKDGHAVVTSRIIEAEGNCVKTRSRWYILGQPSKGYEEWCKEHAPHIDLMSPFKK